VRHAAKWNARRVIGAQVNHQRPYKISNGIRRGGEAAEERAASSARKLINNDLIKSPMGFDEAAKPPKSAPRHRRAS